MEPLAAHDAGLSFLQIADGQRVAVHVPHLTDAQLAHRLGGEPESAFYLDHPSPAGSIIGYVAADSVVNAPAHLQCAQIGPPHRIHGPLVILGVDSAGRHRSLSRSERSIFVVEPDVGGGLPHLCFYGPEEDSLDDHPTELLVEDAE